MPRQDTTKAEKGGNATLAVHNKLPYHVARLLSSIGLDWGTFGASYIRKKIEPFNQVVCFLILAGSIQSAVLFSRLVLPQMIVDELIDTIPSMIGVLAEIIAGNNA